MTLNSDRRYVHNIPAARGLRRSQTASEHVLWECLRGRRLQGLKFRRQHAVYGYVLDFYCDELKLAIEVDGSIHDDPDQRERDRMRQSILEESGIIFVRVPAKLLMEDPDVIFDKLSDLISPLPEAKRTRERGRG